MWAIYVLAILGILYELFAPAPQPWAPAVDANAQAQQFMVYRQAVETYVQANPGITGTVNNAAVTMPTGGVIPRTGAAWVASGPPRVLWVWVQPTGGTPAVANQIAGGGGNIGINQSGTLFSPQVGTVTGVTVPAAVPNGALVSVVEPGT